ncbi:SusC/RagA family TonB-linked outer membrane protein [Sphingobacterium chuzhouense]|uniref:TonB-dependent receptor n=2 Tax=Sphingobacterium chuzhouense TaxID=1742264 RepID=A0ABR7XMF0_9SPHI|nr:TonB-dependent receptor [Sphingobacterium chuzhouense]MBD1420343.1 TonB-dependent receptor [Sphingobacterium chuzhouense]
MKLFLILTLLFSFTVYGNVTAQKVNIDVKSVPFKTVVQNLQKQTGYSFIIKNEFFNKAKPVTLHATNKDILEVLPLLFKNQPFSFVVRGKVISAIEIQETKKNLLPTSDEWQKQFIETAVQQIIRGRVLDENGRPISGVSIAVVGTEAATSTDERGSYAINAKKGDRLLFSYVGYKSLERDVEDGVTIDIIMQEDLSSLDEVVVVGMGQQKKASVIGAISSVKMDDLRMPQRSLTNAMAGKMAGAVVVQRTGELGRDNGGIWIRGISSFSDNRSPLILVDGVEREMQDLSVEEIESVSILKDASATAVYGVRAANGVVLVTTRRGIAQKPVIQFSAEHGLSDLPGLPRFLDGANYAMLYNEALGRDNYSDEYIEKTRNYEDPYLYPNVNWYDEIYKKTSHNSQASLNVRGGGEVARYFVGFGYINESGNLRNSDENEYKSNLSLQRYNFRSNVDISLTKSTTVELEVGGSLTDLHSPGVGSHIYGTDYTPAGELFYWASLATPISNPVRIPIGKDLDGKDIWGWGAPTQVGEKNPLERLLGSGFNTEFRNQFMSQISVNQDLGSFVNGLKFRFSFSFDAYNQTDIQRRKGSYTYGVRGRDPETGELLFTEVDQGQEFLGYSRALGSNRAKELKGQLTYNRSFGKHNVGAMSMYYQRDFVNGNAASAILSLPYRRQGLAARATYDFDNRYFAEVNLGYNGSENFPKERRFGLFPAAAVGWILTNESFWSPNSAVSLMKLKGSVGLVGSEALPGGQRYGYLSIYGSGLGGYVFGENGQSYVGTGEDRIGVTNLTWEKGLKHNVGVELSFFNDLIRLDADYFYERRMDILLQRASLPWVAGFNSNPFANMGKMINQGIDGTLEANKRYEWGGVRLYGNFTYAKDKILEQDEAQKNYEYRMRTGHKFGQQFGLMALGLFESEEEISNSPEQTFGVVRPGDVKYQDINGDGLITIDDEVPIGYSNLPEINYGFGFQFDWKGIDIGMFFRGQGRVSYALGGAYIPFNQGVGKGNLFVEALDRWTVDNPNQHAQYPRIANGTSANNWQRSTRTIYDGSFLRLTEMELGYSIKPVFLQRLKVSNLRIYALANNVATFSSWTMWDPETGSSDGRNYPLQRKFNFGFRATF